MIDELFVPYHSHLPQHIQNEFRDDEVVILHKDKTVEDLVADGQGFGMDELHSFAKNRVIFLTPDTTIHTSLDAPSHHKYTLDVTFTFSSTTTAEKRLHVSGVDAQKTSPALNFLLRLILKDSHNGDKVVGVTFTCFSMTPRQQLGSLDLSNLTDIGQKRKISSLTTPSSDGSPHRTIDVEFRFLALNKGHCNLLFNKCSHLFTRVKLSQCEVDGWAINEKRDDQKNERTQNLVLSCAQKEFRKFVEGGLLTGNDVSICEFDLLLHFMLTDVDVNHLGFLIQKSQGLESLKIEFLEIDDKVWRVICDSLRSNQTLKCIELAYTEKFADSFRRLTPERRRSRTNDMLQLLDTNKTLQTINWPKFQQDESLMPDIERRLMENRNMASGSSTAGIEFTAT